MYPDDLHSAIETNDMKLLKRFLDDQRTDVNKLDTNGRTPLHTAIRCYWMHILRLLVADPRTDLNARDSSNRTALAYAKENGFFEVAKLLEAAKASTSMPNEKLDSDGPTATSPGGTLDGTSFFAKIGRQTCRETVTLDLV